ncbi:MAG: phenylalanine--tRNA ligase subunit beta [Phycisphaeraceae bacterium]|nr:phenylalanine--tRNA ligase subunit beta [Phycisphaeraceae bacterium]
MKLSLNWLNRYLSAPTSQEQVCTLLGQQGFPIEEQEELAGGDVFIDAEVTSNRSDCLSHIGMAREVSAGAPDLELKQPDITITESDTAVDTLTSVTNDDTELCPVYTARVIQGVKVGSSPKWLVDCLEAIGLRSVNNVVDVTNFVLMEMGQPLHTFDMDKLDGGKIIVRRATKGEDFTAIDGTKHKLADSMLVIADASRPQAVAGVMGGLDSEVTESTTNILLESARFDQLSVRTTSRRMKLSSDSSYRFERGVDPCGVERASKRAAQLIMELAGGTLAKGVIRVGEDEPQPKVIELRIKRCNDLMGVTLTPQVMAGLLSSLTLNAEIDGDKLNVTIPTYRSDIQREVDLIEEVARMYGMANIPVNDKITLQVRPSQLNLKARKLLGQILVSHGYCETMTFSFVDPKRGKLFVTKGNKPLEIGDERRKAEPMLRPSILPSLMVCRKGNQDVGNTDVKLFETASVWSRNGNDNIVEHRELGMLADVSHPQLALRAMRGMITELVERLGGDAKLEFSATDMPCFSDALAVSVNDKSVGVMGLIDKATQDVFDLQMPVIGASLILQPLIDLYPAQRLVGALSRYPAIERDLSVLVKDEVTWDQIQSEVLATKPEFMESLDFVTTYRGKPIPKGIKSVSLRLTFRDEQSTLRHEQVDGQMKSVMDALTNKLGAEIRA